MPDGVNAEATCPETVRLPPIVAAPVVENVPETLRLPTADEPLTLRPFAYKYFHRLSEEPKSYVLVLDGVSAEATFPETVRLPPTVAAPVLLKLPTLAVPVVLRLPTVAEPLVFR